MLKRFIFAQEDRLDTAWLTRFIAGRKEAERWYLGTGRTDPPTADECRTALSFDMPELLPHNDRVCGLVGDDDQSAGMLLALIGLQGWMKESGKLARKCDRCSLSAAAPVEQDDGIVERVSSERKALVLFQESCCTAAGHAAVRLPLRTACKGAQASQIAPVTDGKQEHVNLMVRHANAG